MIPNDEPEFGLVDLIIRLLWFSIFCACGLALLAAASLLYG